MDYANVRTIGGDLGSASVIVIDDTVSMDWLVNKTVHFFRHESCGKCTPCREGTYWMSNIIERIHHGQGTSGDVDLLLNVAKQIQGKCLCALGEFSTMAVVTGIERSLMILECCEPEPLPLYVKERSLGKAWIGALMSKQVTLTIDGNRSPRRKGPAWWMPPRWLASISRLLSSSKNWNRSACAACAWWRSGARCATVPRVRS